MTGKNIKIFDPCVIGSITTGISLVHGFAGVGEAFNHVMGHPVWTHEMPMMMDRAKELILEQHPDFPCEPPADFRALMASLVADWPDGVPIAEGSETRPGDPVSTLGQAVEHAKRRIDQ